MYKQGARLYVQLVSLHNQTEVKYFWDLLSKGRLWDDIGLEVALKGKHKK